MALVCIDHRDQFASQLQEIIAAKAPKTDRAAIEQFAVHYYNSFPLEELEGRQINDVYGTLYYWWQLLQHHKPHSAKVQVFNPSLEEHGWLTNQTIVMVLCRDMPFVQASLRMALNRSGIRLHAIHSVSIGVDRQEDQFQQWCGDGNKELLVYMEIARHSSESEQQQLASALLEVLDDVSLVVDDRGQMQQKTQDFLAQLPSMGESADNKETEAFLLWLLDNHFTFLGYTEFSLNNQEAAQVIEENIHARLGLMKRRGNSVVQTLINHDQAVGETGLFLNNKVVSFSKSTQRTKVHRSAYPDYISLKQCDETGQVVLEQRFLGLFTSGVYTQDPFDIPLLRQKLNGVLLQSGYETDIQQYRDLIQVLSVLPRDELFQANEQQLFDIAMGVMHIQERRQVRLFVRQDVYNQYISCLVFTPRYIYRTELRQMIQRLLCQEFSALESEFTTFFSESILARTHFIIRVDPTKSPKFDARNLENRVVDLSRSWSDQLQNALIDALGEETGTQLSRVYHRAFPAAYREDFDPRTAVKDIQTCERLTTGADMAMRFYRSVGSEGNEVRFKLFHRDRMLVLSDVIPIMENLGLRVMGEHPYNIRRQDGAAIWVHDFRLIYGFSDCIDVDKVRPLFKQAFSAIWAGEADSDRFNRLVLGAQLSWREVSLLRAYAQYMKQVNFNYSQLSIANTLCRYLDISRDLVKLFNAYFEPSGQWRSEHPDETHETIEQHILEALDQVENLNEDTIIRRFVDMIKGTLRTNYFQTDADGKAKCYLALKLSPQTIPEMPLPAPMFEIFVYSPRMEGVHLRGGKVARGGLRWSDRREDYRTEILGLVKAQQVKNAVIVPVGAKGGFVAKRLPENATRDAIQAEGIACYKLFIQGLLDVTDNLKDGQVEPPFDVVRRDQDDSYLVVAADKGTATFSDIANEVAASYDFWLGDAFASGGSEGYDHKKMGITARGAWVSVQRHFHELGLDVQSEDFTVVAVGDMSGDVFGNGMLRSRHIRLVAAFNHLHIFVDPNPEAAASFVERQRLFDLPRSSWGDYNHDLISEGGGVFSRSSKSISISDQMKRRFNISANRLTPNQLVQALLKAPVDLFWNGGIGTYVKASEETDADVGDKASDAVRINGSELGCRVVGEGGNLGLTQRARMEYALHNGASNTDFIDNAGGVDCSDHEVNIKILLNQVVSEGDLTLKQRNQLLEDMTDEVAHLVLNNNFRQVQAISIAQYQAVRRMGEYWRFIVYLEADGKLNRQLEFLPDDETLVERRVDGLGLTRPELSVLISYSKAMLKEELIEANIDSDGYLCQAADQAFPQPLRDEYAENIQSHRLRLEIVATQIANEMINLMGITFAIRLTESTGASAGEIAKAYVVSRDVFNVLDYWRQIEDLSQQISHQSQMELFSSLMRLVRRSCRWFLRNRRSQIQVAKEVDYFTPQIEQIREGLQELLGGDLCSDWQASFTRLIEKQVPECIARFIAGVPNLYHSLGIAEVAAEEGYDIQRVAQVYFTLGDRLQLHWLSQQVGELKIETHWQALARESLLDDIDWQQRSLTRSTLPFLDENEEVGHGIERWLEHNDQLVVRWQRMVTELRSGETADFPMYSVALRELLDLAQSSCYSRASCGIDGSH